MISVLVVESVKLLFGSANVKVIEVNRRRAAWMKVIISK